MGSGACSVKEWLFVYALRTFATKGGHMSLFSLPSIKAANEVNHCLIKGSRTDRLQTQNKPRYFRCNGKAHIYVHLYQLVRLLAAV